jgi:hypothetical protein
MCFSEAMKLNSWILSIVDNACRRDFPMKLSKKARTCLLLLSSILLAQCVSYDSEFKALETVVETNPRPDAIVGMWHRRENDAGNWAVDIKTRTTLLFKSDGSSVSRWQMFVDGRPEVSEADANKHAQSARWSYSGAGTWLLTYPGHKPSKMRLSSGKLLITGGQAGFVGNHVYTRLE